MSNYLRAMHKIQIQCKYLVDTRQAYRTEYTELATCCCCCCCCCLACRAHIFGGRCCCCCCCCYNFSCSSLSVDKFKLKTKRSKVNVQFAWRSMQRSMLGFNCNPLPLTLYYHYNNLARLFWFFMALYKYFAIKQTRLVCRNCSVPFWELH